ncbi:hypothetical protein [Planococcus salinus]|uniref:ZIP Zinc transporter n=1 Tax=Planococcus salinus TaxID=1848460 RepID=A0A3M8P5P7_9BACL|nr:hypothetical protein [Planococcus salinus]RNF39016.1 hypothetical protein EEX84_11555 [Planococcus salinus]
MFIVSIFVIVGFMIVHVFTNYIKFLSEEPKNVLMSLLSGGSIAYVFLHLVPELTHYQEVVREADLPQWIENIDYAAYVVTLVGIVFFYGINQLSEKSQEKNRSRENLTRPSKIIFGMEISAFALYNMLIGYLLSDLSGDNLAAYLIYFIVFSFHFIANNRILHLTHEDLYTKAGRWILAFAVFLGWLIYETTETSELTVAWFSAFLTGGVILNIMNDELPAEKQSSFISFVGGLIFIALLLQLIL